ncbi:rod shape-determining protein MreC [Candidatus Azambacteria bacterium]|nr:rod shape-determining protein MreC [Candidatus Azambacteria bacterium]
MARGSGKIKLFGFLAVIVFLLIFLNIYINDGKAQNSVFDILKSPVKIFSSVGDMFVGGFKIVFGLKDIISENASLRSENKNLTQKLVEAERLREENELLRKQLSLSEERKQILIDVRILSFEPSNLSEFAVIDKGRNDGLKKDMPVILSGNILFGKISEVYDSYSKVILITDGNNKVNVKVFLNKEEKDAGKTLYNGVLSGYFGKSLFMDLIDKRSDVSFGDLIITSGLDGIYPEGLIVGKVDIIKDDDNAVFKQAYLMPAFLPLTSNLAFVIK